MAFLRVSYLERLVPTARGSTHSGCCYFLPHTHRLCLPFPSELPDRPFCCLRYAHAAAPSCDLPEGYCINTFIDSSNSLGAQDIEERLHSTGDPGSLGHLLVPRHLHRLHASSHPNGQIRLGGATSDASQRGGYRRAESKII